MHSGFELQMQSPKRLGSPQLPPDWVHRHSPRKGTPQDAVAEDSDSDASDRQQWAVRRDFFSW